MVLNIARIQDMILYVILMAKLVRAIVSRPGDGVYSEQQTNGNIVVRHGVLFQTRDCPWVISKEEMLSRKTDSSKRGNIITMKTQCRGRTGNRFVNLSQFLAMGYCCRSKLLNLPPDDSRVPSQDGGHFTTESNFFDFSSVDVLPLEEYRQISENSSVCPPTITLGTQFGYQLIGLHPDLLGCMNRVYLRGCEVAYLGGMVETWNYCPARETKDENNAEAAGTAGSLVVHIRSGDIFHQSPLFAPFGQPPLQFYLDVIANKPWSEVTVLTYAQKEDLVNPTYSRLQEMHSKGLLGQKINFYMDRPFEIDLKTMLCADGIAFARSSLAIMLSAHGRASNIYVPWECGPGTYAREVRTKQSPKIVQDNTTLLAIEKPNAEVYGIEWANGREAYSVYTNFTNSQEQRIEMLETDSVRGLQQCFVG